MSSDKNGAQELPDGWVLCSSKSNPGRKYYFNKKTGKSSWTEPQAEDKAGTSKQKSKKEKAKKNEKLKKEEAQKKSLKKKIDSQARNINKKRNIQGTPTPEKRPEKPSPPTQPVFINKTTPPVPKKNLANTRLSQLRANLSSEAEGDEAANDLFYCTPTPEKPSPSKQSDFNYKKTPPSFKKNLASARLSQLRANLSAEADRDEIAYDKSPNKAVKHKICQNTSSQSEPPLKMMKTDSKSPVLNESKCSTTSQSPNNDSIQSTPSPSQFFAANKIISSMKAQLPEKYCDKMKQKDTFAAIEEGICNQMPEYPFMKHPATPPQFSEASKLVSAIKSKLSYKVTCKDGNIEPFHTAQDRMNSLRTRLSNEVEATHVESSLSKNSICLNEDMDVDCKEVIQKVPVMVPAVHMRDSRENVVSNKEDIVLVVDTNVFIHELDFIKNCLNSHIKGYEEQPTLLVPWRVINELDRLKDNNNGNGALCKRARSAMDYLYKSLPENSRIKGQSLRDSNSHIYPCEVPDDEILNCCLQQSERGKSVILVTNDKNLCNKATINSVKSISISELRPLLTAPPRNSQPLLGADIRHYRDALYHLLANILENEMRAKYNNLWQHVLFKPPPWTLDDVLQCLTKHWIAVFNEVFPRVVEHLIIDLRHALVAIESKGLKSISQSEISNFQELCLDIAKKCQIIPEYMELAKLTVERFERKESTDDVAVVDAFEALWSIFSGYSAKLASGLGIEHNIEDNIPGNDPLAVLVDRCPAFIQHLQILGTAVQGVLNASDEGSKEEAVSSLEAALRECLALVGVNSRITTHSLRIFCNNCGNMLQEASSKFAQLVDVLDACKNKIDN